MAYKNEIKQLSLADATILPLLKKNKTYQMLKDLKNIIHWNKIEKILKKDYKEGQSKEGQKAFNPLFLFKCLLLQKWFSIDSDPDLENQINDRISFKQFIGLSVDEFSPDHSTFSRFRKRISEKTMSKINHEILIQFNFKGIDIHNGIAVDARIIKSASKPINNNKIKELRENKNNNNNNRKPKFTRDIEADWTVKNDKYFYGYKEHVAVDTKTGLVLTSKVSPASHHDYNYLEYCTVTSMHTDKPLEEVYADKGYCGKSNSLSLSIKNIKDSIMRKNLKNAKLTPYEKERNKKISKKRYIVEQYFGLTHLHNRAYKYRFTNLLKNIFDTLCRQIAYNVKRGLKILPAF